MAVPSLGADGTDLIEMTVVEVDMDNELVVDALVGWCDPEFVAAVRAAGIARTETSLADVDAMRTIYVRRRRRATENPVLLAQIDGILRALDSANANEIGMVHFEARDGSEGIIIIDESDVPLFAFPIVGSGNGN